MIVLPFGDQFTCDSSRSIIFDNIHCLTSVRERNAQKQTSAKSGLHRPDLHFARCSKCISNEHRYTPSPENQGYFRVERLIRLNRPNGAIQCCLRKDTPQKFVNPLRWLLRYFWRHKYKRRSTNLMWNDYQGSRSIPICPLLFNFVTDEISEDALGDPRDMGVELVSRRPCATFRIYETRATCTRKTSEGCSFIPYVLSGWTP